MEGFFSLDFVGFRILEEKWYCIFILRVKVLIDLCTLQNFSADVGTNFCPLYRTDLSALDSL